MVCDVHVYVVDTPNNGRNVICRQQRSHSHLPKTYFAIFFVFFFFSAASANNWCSVFCHKIHKHIGYILLVAGITNDGSGGGGDGGGGHIEKHNSPLLLVAVNAVRARVNSLLRRHKLQKYYYP